MIYLYATSRVVLLLKFIHIRSETRTIRQADLLKSVFLWGDAKYLWNVILYAAASRLTAGNRRVAFGGWLRVVEEFKTVKKIPHPYVFRPTNSQHIKHIDVQHFQFWVITLINTVYWPVIKHSNLFM